jgi:hypothetical protein
MKNFLKNLIERVAPTVFKPVPAGLFYIFLQAISREIGGECPWDTSDHCYKGYDTYWYSKCRNNLCPGYRHPLGLIAYISGSDPLSSIDNRFDYSSIRQFTTDDYVPVGTFGVKIRFGFGGVTDLGGWGAGYWGALFLGDNSASVSEADIRIGDKWTILCSAGKLAGAAIPDPANKGNYRAISTMGVYTGDHDTTYTVEIIDFWGYTQNFSNAILQMCLATCDGEWVDFWGEYFGISRLLVVGGYEADEDYKARILKEITRPKGTKAVLLEEAQKYYKSDSVKIVEYCQLPGPGGIGWDGINYGTDPNGDPNTDYEGLQPFQFYIFPPIQTSPNLKFVVDGSKLLASGLHRCWKYVSGYSYYGVGYGGYGGEYGYGGFDELFNIEVADSVGDMLFASPGDVGDAFLIGSPDKFSGAYFEFLTPGDGSFIWEYWTGNDWAGLTVKDLTFGLTTDGWIWWKLPDDWKADDDVPYNIPPTGTRQYWVRCRVVSMTTAPIADLIQISYAGATNRGHYIGYAGNEVSDVNAYNPVKRDRNNIYIYALESWLSKPILEVGLQAIIDRLKTAGTICIINSTY